MYRWNLLNLLFLMPDTTISIERHFKSPIGNFGKTVATGFYYLFKFGDIAMYRLLCKNRNFAPENS